MRVADDAACSCWTPARKPGRLEGDQRNVEGVRSDERAALRCMMSAHRRERRAGCHERRYAVHAGEADDDVSGEVLWTEENSRPPFIFIDDLSMTSIMCRAGCLGGDDGVEGASRVWVVLCCLRGGRRWSRQEWQLADVRCSAVVVALKWATPELVVGGAPPSSSLVTSSWVTVLTSRAGDDMYCLRRLKVES